VNNFGEKVSFIWQVADLLRGPYKPNQYKEVILPMTVLRRLDCVLEPTKQKVLEKIKGMQTSKIKNLDSILCRVSGVRFFNTSRFTF
jgi:type I restriction enzyme M protein